MTTTGTRARDLSVGDIVEGHGIVSRISRVYDGTLVVAFHGTIVAATYHDTTPVAVIVATRCDECSDLLTDEWDIWPGPGNTVMCFGCSLEADYSDE